MLSVAVLLCFVALCICLNADIVKQRELLRMPDAIDMSNTSIIRVNPFSAALRRDWSETSATLFD